MAKNTTKPMSPDDLNELLAQPSYESDVDERTEGEIRGTFKQLADVMGPEAFIDMGMNILLSMEDEIRANSKPGDPALERLNRYYRERGA